MAQSINSSADGTLFPFSRVPSVYLCRTSSSSTKRRTYMSHMSTIKKGIAALTAFWFVVGFTAPSFADVSLGGNNWVDSIKFGGDIRLRHDTLQQAGGSTDRNRERFRLRFGLEATIQDVSAIFRMASGTGSPLLANQTGTGQMSPK